MWLTKAETVSHRRPGWKSLRIRKSERRVRESTCCQPQNTSGNATSAVSISCVFFDHVNPKEARPPLFKAPFGDHSTQKRSTKGSATRATGFDETSHGRKAGPMEVLSRSKILLPELLR